MKRWRLKPTWKRQAILGALILILFVGAGWYLTSSHFRDFVRSQVVAQVERVTGGRAELGSLEWDLSRLRFVFHDLTVHGREAADQAPLFHVERVEVRAQIVSLARGEFRLRYLGVHQPTVHYILFPDGSSNLPPPKKPSTLDSGSPLEPLLALAVGRVELQGGRLLFQERSQPFELAGNDMEVALSYHRRQKRYDGHVQMGKLDAKFDDMRPLAAQVEARFQLWASRLHLESLRVQTAESRVDASGEIEDFRRVHGNFSYQADLDLGEAGSVLRRRELRGGRLELSGQFALAQQGPSGVGRLVLRGLLWQDPAFQVGNVSGSAHYTLAPEQIAVNNLAVSILGGKVTGSARIRHWQAEPGAAGPIQQGQAQLRLSSLELSRLAAAVPGRASRLQPLHPAGVAEGTVGLEWKRSFANTIARLALDVRPPLSPTAQQMPVSATLRADYEAASGHLRASEIRLLANGARLEASGLVAERSALDVTFTADDLTALRPLLRAFDLPGGDLAELQGRAALKGHLSGSLKQPSFQGRVEVSDFATVLPPPEGQAIGKVQRVDWQELSAEVAYSPAELQVRKGMLRRDGAQAYLSGTADLVKGTLSEHSPFHLDLKLRDLSMTSLASLLGRELPVSGTVNLDLAASGTRAQPHAEGSLSLSGGEIYGTPYRRLQASFVLEDQLAQVRDLSLTQNGARVTGEGDYHLQTRQFHLNIRGRDFQLANYPPLQKENYNLGGLASFDAQGSGTLERPQIEASLVLRDLVLNQEPLGSMEVRATTREQRLEISAASRLNGGALDAEGSILMTSQWPSQFRLTFRSFDFDPFLPASSRQQLTSHSEMAGTIELQGPLKQPRDLRAQADISELAITVENIKVHNQGPVRFVYSGQVLNLESFHLVGDGTDFRASGNVSLASERRNLDLRLDGTMNLKLLQTVNRDLYASGTATLQAAVTGTLSEPDLKGRLEIADAGFSIIDVPVALGSVNGTLVFNEDRMQVQELTAELGGGQLKLGGFVTYAGGVRFNLTAEGSSLRVRYPEGISSVADVSLRFVGSLEDALLTGDVLVTRFALNRQFDFALYLARSRQPVSTVNPESLANNIRLDVHVTSTPELHVETSLAQVSAEIDLRVRGRASKPAVLGRINLNEGQVQFAGTTYHLRRGDVTFTNPTRIEPVLDVEATTRVRQYDISLGFHGPVDKLSTSYRSEPPLPTADIIALLAMGRTREESALNQQPTTSFTETFSNAILGQAIDSAVTNRVQRLFGVSRIKIDPQVGGPESGGSAGARITIEQQVSNDVILTYITNVTNPERQVIQGEFNLTRNTSLVIVRDENGVLGFDVRIRQRMR